jgi:hypothetical protein
MNVWWNAAAKAMPETKDTKALALMLDYVVAEAERLGLHRCAHHAALARQASAPVKRDPLHS